jgi:PST family polysaccharide transporter
MLDKLANVKKLSPQLIKIIANTGWLFLDRILRMGLGLFVGVWVARYLGVEQFGVFNYSIAFAALFSTVAKLGLDNILVRRIVHKPENSNQLLGTVFGLKILGGFISALLAIGSIVMFKHDDYLTISLVAILASVGIFQAFDTIDLWFQSQVQSKYTVIAKNTAFIAIALLKITLINIHAPLQAFAWSTLAESCLGAVGLIIIFNISGYSLRSWSLDLSLAKILLKESYPLIFAGLSVIIYMKVDQIMLGEMIGKDAVGIYSAAARISEVWYLIPVAISSSVSPAIFAAKEINEALYYRRIEKLTQTLVLISLVIALPMSFLSKTVIVTLFGEEYAAAAPILAIHIWASLFVFLGVAVTSWYISEGLTNLALCRSLIALVINILLNLLLIPLYTGVGAAIATVISYAVGHVFANATHHKTRKIFMIQVKSLLNLFTNNRTSKD